MRGSGIFQWVKLYYMTENCFECLNELNLYDKMWLFYYLPKLKMRRTRK